VKVNPPPSSNSCSSSNSRSSPTYLFNFYFAESPHRQQQLCFFLIQIRCFLLVGIISIFLLHAVSASSPTTHAASLVTNNLGAMPNRGLIDSQKQSGNVIHKTFNNVNSLMDRRSAKVPSMKWPLTLVMGQVRFDAFRYPDAASKAKVPSSLANLTLYNQPVINAPTNVDMLGDSVHNFMPKKMCDFSGSHRPTHVANM
jgi:hypothetical protein